MVTSVGVSYFLTSSLCFPPVFLSNFRHFPFVEMEAARQRALVLVSAATHKKEKVGASTSAPKVIRKGSLKRKNEGKANRPFKKGSVILVGNKQKKLSPSKPSYGASKCLMTVTSPVTQRTVRHLLMHKEHAIEMVESIIKDADLDPCAE